MTKYAILRLPTPPPSVNRMWRSVGGKNILSAEGRAWKSAAAWELKSQPGISGPCYWSAEILIPGTSTKSDIDNLSKGILDAIYTAGKAPDDRYLVDLRLRFWMGDKVQVSIKQEEVTRWAEIRGASKALAKKLGAAFHNEGTSK